nr:cytochrome P450 71A1-like [Quercus suber]
MAFLSLLSQQWWQELHGVTKLALFLYTLLLPILFLKLRKLGDKGKLNLPPSPPKLPIIGNLHQLGTLPHRSFRMLSSKYGPLMLLHLGHVPTLVVSSAEMAREVMKTHDIAFSNRPKTTAANIFSYGFTDVDFAPYGDYWRHTKKIVILELLSLKKVQSFQFVREEEVTLLVNQIRACLSKGPVNLSDMLLAISNNITSRCVLGSKFGEKDGKSTFGELSKKMMMQHTAFSFGDFFPSLGWMDNLTGLVASLKASLRAMDALFDQLIEEYKMLNVDEDKKDFMHILLRLQKEGMLEIELTKENLKAVILDMFVAGTDTTATTLEWAMAELIKNPSMMKKAQEEVRRVAGKKSKLDETDITHLQYLKCIIKETLRLHVPAPLLVPRETSTNVKLGGYDIPSKVTVYVNAWAIQRDPKLWDQPEEFLPERFNKNPVDFKGHDFHFIPFGSGRRGCPGIAFGSAAAEYVIANLLYHFNWKLPGDEVMKDLDMSEEYGMTVHRRFPLLLVPALYSPN